MAPTKRTTQKSREKVTRKQLATKAVLKENQSINRPRKNGEYDRKYQFKEDASFTTTYPKKILSIKSKQEIEFQGFRSNSDKILPTWQKEEIQLHCQKLLYTDQPSIRSVAVVVGKLAAALPAVQYGALHFWEIKKDKKRALKQSFGYLDKKMILSCGAKLELQWWCDNILQAYCPNDMGKPTLVIDSDASGSGWGATDTKTAIGGRWNKEEREKFKINGINYLEMLAAYLALKSFCKQMKNIHVQLRIDNMTAVTYLTNMGGVNSKSCNEMAKEIWHWCIQRHIWISVKHIPGKENVVADFKSRNFSDEGTEWQLNRDIFNKICQKFGTPQIDLFASRLNTQLPRYISRNPDPEAESVDAFMTDWGKIYFYAFPPFGLIDECLQKIKQEQASGIMIVPINSPTKPWFRKLQHMTIDDPFLLPPVDDLLTQPATGDNHEWSKQLYLVACKLSGDPVEILDYKRRSNGEHQLKNSTTLRDMVSSESGELRRLKATDSKRYGLRV